MRVVEQIGEVVASINCSSIDREAFDGPHRAVEADHRRAADRQDEVGPIRSIGAHDGFEAS